MDSVTRTNQHKDYGTWKGDLSVYLHIGDSVCPELVAHFSQLLPPACWEADLIQMGEPNDHNGSQGRARFETIQKHMNDWVYVGRRGHRERASIDDCVRRHECGRPYAPADAAFCWFCHT